MTKKRKYATGWNRSSWMFRSGVSSATRCQDYPSCGGGLLTECIWVSKKGGCDYGIALNPGFEIGFDMESQPMNERIDALTAHTKH